MWFCKGIWKGNSRETERKLEECGFMEAKGTNCVKRKLVYTEKAKNCISFRLKCPLALVIFKSWSTLRSVYRKKIIGGRNLIQSNKVWIKLNKKIKNKKRGNEDNIFSFEKFDYKQRRKRVSTLYLEEVLFKWVRLTYV